MRIYKFVIYVFILLNIFSCTKDIIEPNTPLNNFEVFWKVMNERYVFFEEKNLNWDSIYNEYRPRFAAAQTQVEMKELFSEIIEYIGDRHVRISSESMILSPIKSYEDEGQILNFPLLHTFYQMKNIQNFSSVTLAQLPGSILYFHIGSMKMNQSLDMDNIINYIKNSNYEKGIVVDLRDNGGGSVDVFMLAGLFFSGNRTIYYNKYKTGPSQKEFSEYKPVSLNGYGLIPRETPVCLLFNNYTYSGGNNFAYILNDIMKCVNIGTKSGGGGGGRISVYLPVGWKFSYTVYKSYNGKKELMENGFIPDIELKLGKDFWFYVHGETGEDPQFETAINELKKITY